MANPTVTLDPNIWVEIPIGGPGIVHNRGNHGMLIKESATQPPALADIRDEVGDVIHPGDEMLVEPNLLLWARGDGLAEYDNNAGAVGGTTTGDQIAGQYAGSAATFAALPTTDASGAAVSVGDWAELTADDGTNLAGRYVFDGTNWVFDTPAPTGAAASNIGVQPPLHYRGEVSNAAGIVPLEPFVATCAGAWTFRFSGKVFNTATATGLLYLGTAATLLDVFDGGADRIDEATPVKTYTVTLTEGQVVHPSFFAGGGAVVEEMQVDITPPAGCALVARPKSDLFLELSTWRRGGSTGVVPSPIREEIRHGKPVVVFDDPITNGWQYLANSENLPKTKTQDVLIEWAKGAPGATIGIRVGRPGLGRDTVVDADTGNVVRSDANVETLAVRDTGNFLQIILRYQPDPAYTTFQIYPGYSTTGVAGSQQGATGEIAISAIKLNHVAKPVPTGIVFDGGMVQAAPSWDNSGTPFALTGAFQAINTGVDLTEIDSLVVHFRRTTDVWPVQAAVALRHVVRDIDQGYLLHWHNDAFAALRLNTADEAAGIINFRQFTTDFEILEIEFLSRAKGTSRRLGEMVFLKSAKFANDAAAMSAGYLPVKPGTVTNGALTFPQWAALYSEFVVGPDIVFPADVDGMFLRNLGGAALGEGLFQADEIGSHSHSYTRPPLNQFTQRGSSTNVARRGTNATVQTGLTGGDETRPVNRAYQLYTIVDTYVEIPPVTATTPAAFVYDKTTTTPETVPLPPGFTTPVVVANSAVGDCRISSVTATDFVLQIFDSAGTAQADAGVQVQVMESI